MGPEALASDLLAFTRARLEELAAGPLPGFRPPRVLAGHQVGADVPADLVFTLGMLHDLGVDQVAGRAVAEVVAEVLAGIDGAATHTFFSYRVAETAARWGPFDGNPLLEGLDSDQRRQVAAACDSRDWVAALDRGETPRNYAAVLARCELGRQRLGLLDDATLLDDLVDRTASLLSESAEGWLDDSHTGAGRYDIYTADIYLFCEPLADRLGPVWDRGAANALRLVQHVGATNGAAFGWGRSTGALAACLTLELAGLALARDLGADRPRWLARAQAALEAMDGWFANGLVTAHQYRSTYRYRGPFRRLQMTLDCLGKLADTALALRSAAPGTEAAAPEDAFPDDDSWVAFRSEPAPAGVWAYRSRQTAFVLPVVGTSLNDYLPAPHNPGLFEVPVEADLPTGVPVVFHGGRRFVPAGLPAAVAKEPAGLTVTYDRLLASAQWEPDAATPSLPGRRRVVYRVEGASLHVEEELELDPGLEEVPNAVAVQITETTGRPLAVRWECPAPHQAATVDTSGLKEYRSFWAELPVVHQLDIVPRRHLRFSYTVTPKLRVATSATSWQHHYHRSLYDPMAERVHDVAFPWHLRRDRAGGAAFLRHIDIFHLHWPEWLLRPDPAEHEAFIALLRDAGVRIVWTQHNLEPHSKDPGYAEGYRAWAAAADAVLHHSHWGRRQVEGRYRYRPGAVHAVIPHGHFGNLMAEVAAVDRAEVERSLGLAPCGLRLGVVGAPRAEKDVQLVLDAVAACRRHDVQLLVLSLRGDEVVPDDPRIVARPYEFVDRSTYNQRLAAIDALVLPFAAEGMLSTGTVGDAVGLGLPALVSSWPYLHEVLDEAAIPYGDTAEDLAACIEDLDPGTLAAAAAAARQLQQTYAWSRVAARTLEVLEQVGTTKL